MTQVDNYTKSLEELGYTYFGPLLFNYFDWLKSEIGNSDKILFNSREGLFLQEIYELFKEKYPCRIKVRKNGMSEIVFIRDTEVNYLLPTIKNQPIKTLHAILFLLHNDVK